MSEGGLLGSVLANDAAFLGLPVPDQISDNHQTGGRSALATGKVFEAGRQR
jgi:hypothetical protein